MKKNLYVLIILILIIPLAGELKLYPFNNTFRVSVAVPIFFFLLLWAKDISLISSGIIAGISVVIFRVILDFAMKGQITFSSEFSTHFSAFFFYFTYACLFYFAKVIKFRYNPFVIGFLSVCIDTLSNTVELIFRHLTFGDAITLYLLLEILILAIIRTFFVLGIFTMIKLRETEVEVYHQQEQNKHMLFLISSLYEESVQLKKSLQNAEHITRDCYNLYKALQNNENELSIENLSQKLLAIAGEVHEIKKDNQRIYAGLSKMISSESSTDYIDIEKMGNIIIQTNEKYAHSLGKDIKFVLNIEDKFPPLHIFTILSLINNLVSNAVEAIEDAGLIKLNINKKDQYIEFKVSDNGPGIPDKKKELIFSPGYTTKYDVCGTPSTGMGLPYIKDVAHNLNGKITLETKSDTNETIFSLLIPINNLVEGMIT